MSLIIRRLFILFSILFSNSIQAQDLYLEWAKAMRGISNEWGKSITSDALGNIFITGGFKDSVDFDPAKSSFYLNSNGYWDVFILKLDSDGDFVWAKSLGGSLREEGYSIKTDLMGNVYVAGYFEGTVDFDPGQNTFSLSSNGSYDAFILKLDDKGNFIWAKSLGQKAFDWSESIAIDVLGKVYICGSFNDTVDFDPGPPVYNLISNGGLADAFVLKLDENGDFIWAKTFGGSKRDFAISITTQGLNNVYVCGGFSDTVDFDPSSSVFNLIAASNLYDENDLFVMKLDSGGNFIWAKSTGGLVEDGEDQALSITTDVSGDLYLTGFFTEITDFDFSSSIFNLKSTGKDDVFILKLEASGTFIWARSFGGNKVDKGNFILTDSIKNSYITGFYRDTVDFDPGSSTYNKISNGDYDVFIEMLDKNGDFVWVKSMGGPSSDEGYSLTMDAQGSLYASGYFNSTADFNPDSGTYNLVSKGGGDIFAMKLSICGFVSGLDVVSACNNYTWIDGNNYTSSNNTATDTSINAHGCDSVSTLNLTIYNLDVSVTVNNPKITANAVGLTYQWLDCDNNYAVLSGDTAQTFIPTKNGNYAVKVSSADCSDTSECVNITGVGINQSKKLNNISIFPNPSSGLVNIDLKENKNQVSYKIYNLQGQLIQEDKFQNVSELNLEIKFPGTYLIKLILDGIEVESVIVIEE